jgi:polyisoprenoid-binding protein YceI
MSSFKASATTPRTKSVFKHAFCAVGLSLAVSVISTQTHAGCQYVVTNDWGSGYTAAIKITNSGTSAINGWTVGWQYSGNNRATSAWNATMTGSNPYSATNVSFNASIPVGQTVEFGIQGTKSAGAAEVPAVTGTGCSTVTSSTASTSRSSSSVSSSRSSSSVSSSVSTSRSSSSVSSSVSTSRSSSSVSSSASSTSVSGGVLFYENFESGTVNTQPSGWQNFIGWVANNSNTSSGTEYALIDSTKSYNGTKSIHFKGGSRPAQIVRALPSGTQRLYTRAYVNMSVAMGNVAGDNHEHIFGIKRTLDANDEIRVGQIKGVLGTNHIPSDNIAPKASQWWSGPQMAANTWYCVETAYLADQAYDTLYMWVNGNLVHTIDSSDDWNNGALGADWMSDKFNYVMFGFHSFSGRDADVWMDELVVSTQPIGCGTVNPGSSSSSVSSSSRSSSSVSSSLSSSSRSSSSVSSSLSSSSRSSSSSSSASVSSIASNAAWTLNTTDSYLNFVTTKNTHVVEAHNFTGISADISTSNVATLTIDLNTGNTGVALRDQRLRELLFETGTYPTATVTVSVPSTLISGLAVGQSTQASISGTLNLHGVTGTVTATVSVQKLSNSKVIVQSLAPVLVKAGDYSLTAGVEALRAAVGIASISVAVPVDFVLVFDAR